MRERALQENVSYDDLLTLVIAKEQSAKGAGLLEKANEQLEYHHNTAAQQVRRLQKENQKLKAQLPKPPCQRCGHTKCDKGRTCPAWGQKFRHVPKWIILQKSAVQQIKINAPQDGYQVQTRVTQKKQEG